MDTKEIGDEAAQESVQNPEHMPIESPSICVTNDDNTERQETAQNSDTTSDNADSNTSQEMALNADNKCTENPTIDVTAIDIGAVANNEAHNSSDVSVIDSDDMSPYDRYRLFIMFWQLFNQFFALYQMLAVAVNWDCITCKLKYDMFGAHYYHVFGTLVHVSDIISFVVGSALFLSNSVGMIGYCSDNLALIVIYALLMVVISAGCLAIRLYLLGGYTVVVSVLACVFVYVFLFHVRRDLLPPRNREQQRADLGADAPSL